MGPGRFQETAASYRIMLDPVECKNAVADWREANPAIVNSWWACERAMHNCCKSVPGTVIRVRNVHFVRRPGAVLIRLPGGRHLVYRRPNIQWNEDSRRAQFCYMGSGGGGWSLQRMWPGKIVENIVQAIARDVLADAMVELHRMRVPLVATVHDELVAEVPECDADATFDVMQRVMRSPPAWGLDLPMDAQGFIAKRYQKK